MWQLHPVRTFLLYSYEKELELIPSENLDKKKLDTVSTAEYNQNTHTLGNVLMTEVSIDNTKNIISKIVEEKLNNALDEKLSIKNNKIEQIFKKNSKHFSEKIDDETNLEIESKLNNFSIYKMRDSYNHKASWSLEIIGADQFNLIHKNLEEKLSNKKTIGILPLEIVRAFKYDYLGSFDKIDNRISNSVREGYKFTFGNNRNNENVIQEQLPNRDIINKENRLNDINIKIPNIPRSVIPESTDKRKEVSVEPITNKEVKNLPKNKNVNINPLFNKKDKTGIKKEILQLERQEFVHNPSFLRNSKAKKEILKDLSTHRLDKRPNYKRPSLHKYIKSEDAKKIIKKFKEKNRPNIDIKSKENNNNNIKIFKNNSLTDNIKKEKRIKIDESKCDKIIEENLSAYRKSRSIDVNPYTKNSLKNKILQKNSILNSKIYVCPKRCWNLKMIDEIERIRPCKLEKKPNSQRPKNIYKSINNLVKKTDLQIPSLVKRKSM